MYVYQGKDRDRAQRYRDKDTEIRVGEIRLEMAGKTHTLNFPPTSWVRWVGVEVELTSLMAQSWSLSPLSSLPLGNPHDVEAG